MGILKSLTKCHSALTPYNFVAKAVWLTGSTGNCGRSFRSAFLGITYTEIYDSPSDTPLLRIITGSQNESVIDGVHVDDYYELLSKGIGGYNQGAKTFKDKESWLTLLTNPKTSKKINKAIRYALEVRHDNLGLPYRTYVWKGGTTPEQTTTDPVTGIVTVTKPAEDWCFAFGEREWMSGDVFDDVKKAARGDPLALPPIPPIGQVNCATGQ